MYSLDRFSLKPRYTNPENWIITLHGIPEQCCALGDWQRYWRGSPAAISEVIPDNPPLSPIRFQMSVLSLPLHHVLSLTFQAAWFQIQLHFRPSWARSCALQWSPVPSTTDFKELKVSISIRAAADPSGYSGHDKRSGFHSTSVIGSTQLP